MYVDLTFESAHEILCCDHSNETGSGFAWYCLFFNINFYKMKINFGIFLEF